jgi:hypothetical protein
MTCPTCAAQIGSGDRFCEVCGAPVAQADAPVVAPTCQRCGHQLPGGGRFCEVCGAPAGGTEVDAPTTSLRSAPLSAAPVVPPSAARRPTARRDEASPPPPPADTAVLATPPPERPRRAIVAVPIIAACLILAAAGGGAAYWLTRPSGATPATHAAAVQRNAKTGHTDGSAAAGRSHSDSVAAMPSPPPPTGTATLAPGTAGSDPHARIASTMTAFFVAINERRFTDAYAVYSPTEQDRVGSLDSWAAGYRSTTDKHVTIRSVDRSGSGQVLAHVTFRSRQDPADAPDGRSTCLDWSILYNLVPANAAPTAYLIDSTHHDPPPGQDKAYRPCG